MRRRYLYPLLYALPALILSGVFMAMATVALAGVLWIFVFGDNPWPAYVERASSVFMGVVWLGGWIALLGLAFHWGKRQEASAVSPHRHAALAIAATLGLVLLIGLQQCGVGNLGPKTPIMACVDWCSTQGFPASSTPGDGACHCHDATGKVVKSAPQAAIPVH